MMETNPLHLQPNFFLLTGGPGAGKSSVLQGLIQKGYAGVSEAARMVIQQQKEVGGNIHPFGDRRAFCELLLKHCIQDFQKAGSFEQQPVFFDRGIPDLYAYRNISEGQAWQRTIQSVQRATQQYRYNPKVFLFPPWDAIYTHDLERTHSLEQAKSSFGLLVQAYEACGYHLVEVPRQPVEKRVDFILKEADMF